MAEKKMKPTFPEFNKALAAALGAEEAHVRHCVRHCREADLLARGRPGGGAPVVTSEDAAKALLAVLRATNPLDAPTALRVVNATVLWGKLGREVLRHKDLTLWTEPELPDVPGLPEDWSSLTFSALLTAIIDARRADPEFRLVGAIKVNRGLSPLSFFDWVDAGSEVTTLDFSYPPTNDSGDIFAFQEPEAHGITIQASCGAGVLLDLADWLEGRPSD
ncbi:MAG: hypothetical protein V3S59_03555 [Alphaproteobacteria bacterium]